MGQTVIAKAFVGPLAEPLGWCRLGNNVSFLQFSQNIDGFRQNDSQGLLEFIKLYNKTN